jgi:sterol desaturase/sphingolipid hydroxylase (fatty acid hydroxylase superfamily)
VDLSVVDLLNDAVAIPSPTGLALTFITAALALGTLEFFFPASRQNFWTREWRVDIAYWFFTPLFTKITTNAALAGVFLLFFLATERPIDATLLDGYGPLSHQPLWLQTIEILLIADFLDYWTHRMFHTSRLWRFHAIHHSPEEMTWLSASRLHPLNDLVTRLVQVVPIILAGYSARGIILVVPYLLFYVLFLHANVRWDFGRLRYILVSPAYHRWHHTSEVEGIDRNFAGIFPVWDILFGTCYFPRRLPTQYGVHADPPPRSLIGQLFYPFRRAKSEVNENNCGRKVK